MEEKTEMIQQKRSALWKMRAAIDKEIASLDLQETNIHEESGCKTQLIRDIFG